MKQRNCRGQAAQTKRVMRRLADAADGKAKAIDPIVEKLRQCPEAFKVGEILGKAFNALKYGQEEAVGGDRFLPPPGAIIPPIV